MTPDSPSLESDLRELTPSYLDPALLDRLEACTDGSLTALTPTELQFEATLRKLGPAALSPDLFTDLEKIVSEVPFAKDEKVVFFPKAGVAPGKVRRFPRPMWAAAAAVALIGAASALLIPAGQKSAPVAQETKISSAPIFPNGSSNIVSAGYDEGVIWNAGDQPRRVTRLQYNDRVTEKDASGKPIESVRPRIEYLVVPENAD